MLVQPNELAASIITPHYDAVRDVFAEYCPPGGARLTKLRRTKLVVDPTIHDTERHYAGCRDDGLEIRVAPEGADLQTNMLVAILAHEFGHAADFAYPGRWIFRGRKQPAQWCDEEEGRFATKARKLWRQRSDDQVEWSADAIAYAVTGRRIGYCGRCVIQCFDGVPRPAGLR